MDRNLQTEPKFVNKAELGFGLFSSVACGFAWQQGLTPSWPWWINGLPFGVLSLKTLMRTNQNTPRGAEVLNQAQNYCPLYQTGRANKPKSIAMRDRRFDFIP